MKKQRINAYVKDDSQGGIPLKGFVPPTCNNKYQYALTTTQEYQQCKSL
jgi:hypothetical protein